MGISHREAYDVTERLLDKYGEELKEYFPALFASHSELQTGVNLKRSIQLELEEIITGEDKTDELNKVLKEIVRTMRPGNFNNGAAIKKSRQDFENLCIILQREMSRPVKDLTTREFYTLVNHLKKQSDALSSSGRRK